MSRRAVSLLLMAALFIAALALAPGVLLTVFAGVLFAVFLRGGGAWIAARTGLGPGAGVGAFAFAIVLVLVGFGVSVAPAIADEFGQLVERLPGVVADLRERVEATPLGARLLERLSFGSLFSGGGEGAPAAAVAGTFGAAGTFVVILFIGLYGALDPAPYRKGLLALFAPPLRPRAAEVTDAAVDALGRWLAAQLSAMAVVGTLTALGLWVAGIPLAFALGAIAGLLAFIPNIGPLLALAPGLLMGFSEGGDAVWWVLAVYLGVQALESYVVTPLLQQQSVDLPPAFLLAVQLLFSVLFGLIGLALAMPAAALVLTLVREVYLKDYLDAPQEPREK